MKRVVLLLSLENMLSITIFWQILMRISTRKRFLNKDSLFSKHSYINWCTINKVSTLYTEIDIFSIKMQSLHLETHLHKRPMSYNAHLRKQFKSINTSYDYMITLIKRREKPIIYFLRNQLLNNWFLRK